MLDFCVDREFAGRATLISALPVSEVCRMRPSWEGDDVMSASFWVWVSCAKATCLKGG